MGNYTKYTPIPDTNPGPSPSIWSENDIWGFDSPVEGYDRFDTFHVLVASGNGLLIDESDDQVALSQLTTDRNGVLRFTFTSHASNEDNDEIWIQDADGAAGYAVIDEGVGACAFEARIRTSNVTDDNVAIAVGLVEEGATGANNALQTDDSGALADLDYIAFRTLHVNSGTAGQNAQLDIAYNTNGGGGETVYQEIAQTLAVDTWYKVGLLFDGRTLHFYVNGQEVGSGIRPAATNFPDGEEMLMFFAAKAGANSFGATVDIDWWRYAQGLA